VKITGLPSARWGVALGCPVRRCLGSSAFDPRLLAQCVHTGLTKRT
jgi:hypothetical protein